MGGRFAWGNERTDGSGMRFPLACLAWPLGPRAAATYDSGIDGRGADVREKGPMQATSGSQRDKTRPAARLGGPPGTKLSPLMASAGDTGRKLSRHTPPTGPPGIKLSQHARLGGPPGIKFSQHAPKR